MRIHKCTPYVLKCVYVYITGYIHVWECIYVYTSLCIWSLYVYVYAHMYNLMHARMHISPYYVYLLYVYVWAHFCIPVASLCIYVCACMCTSVLQMGV